MAPLLISDSKPDTIENLQPGVTSLPAIVDPQALRRIGLGHLAGGDSPRGPPWNGCGCAAVTLNGVVKTIARERSSSWR
jgi:hypothetical protein